MINTYGSDPRHIRAAIGPNIGQCCFETDEDVPNALLGTYGDAISPYISKRGNKFYVNLKAVNAHALTRRGVESIDISTDCTLCQTDRFWSARKHRDERGSQGAIIVCKGGIGK
jgi:copper oxidase (laccase) domain-containing protein